MEITMTLTVSPTQAEQIAKLLQDTTASTTVVNSAPALPAAPPQTSPVAPAAPVAVPTPATQYAAPVAAPAAPATAPTAAPTYTIAQLQTALSPLLDAGKVGQIQQLVQSFGVNTLMEIPPARYGEFANGLRAMGGVL